MKVVFYPDEAPGDPMLVHVGAVLGEPVVDDRPLSGHVVQLRVQAGDLTVPLERHVHLDATPERDWLCFAAEL